jgi:hypothetical protein
MIDAHFSLVFVRGWVRTIERYLELDITLGILLIILIGFAFGLFKLAHLAEEGNGRRPKG